MRKVCTHVWNVGNHLSLEKEPMEASPVDVLFPRICVFIAFPLLPPKVHVMALQKGTKFYKVAFIHTLQNIEKPSTNSKKSLPVTKTELKMLWDVFGGRSCWRLGGGWLMLPQAILVSPLS